jgi:hypothetical protein
MDDMREKKPKAVYHQRAASRSQQRPNRAQQTSGKRQYKNHRNMLARKPLLCAEEGFGAKFEPSKWPYTKLLLAL